jgi:dihydroflavonol-4-reductase
MLIFAHHMKVLVTGANGLLGHHVVMQLLEHAHDVRIIVRSAERIYFDLAKVDLRIGDFTVEQNFENAAFGFDAVIHIAAITATNLLHLNDYKGVNVDSNQLILDVCNRLKIKRIVFVSSANTIGYVTNVQLSDELSPIQYPFTKSFYAQSKLQAEEIYQKASNPSENHIIIINPTFMIGAYDVKPSSGKLLLMGWRKRLLFVPRGGKNFVAAADVAVSICNALTLGTSGERYLASGINLTFKEFYTIQSRVGGYQQTVVQVPDMLLELVAKVGDLLQILGLRTDVCSRNINQLTICEYYTNAKSKAILRQPNTSLEQAINQALEWFKANSYL